MAGSLGKGERHSERGTADICSHCGIEFVENFTHVVEA